MIGTVLAWLSGNLRIAAYFAGVALLAVVAFFIRKSGADAERLKQAKADIKASSTIARERARARGESDAALDKEVDRWTRP